MKFSKELKEKIKKYFRDTRGIELSDVKADQYLESLGRLGQVLIEAGSPGHGSTPSGRRGGCVTQAGGRAGKSQVSGGTEPLSEYPVTPVAGDNK